MAIKTKDTDQKKHWNREYAQGSPHFQALASEDPSRAVKKFMDYLAKLCIPSTGSILEVGCGMGRNTNWLATLGFSVTGMDVSDVAIVEAARRWRKKIATGSTPTYIQDDISTRWPLEQDSFDFILDFATSHLLSINQLWTYSHEVLRTLKPGGRFVIYTLDRSVDEHAKRLLRHHPGLEPNTYILPEINHQERVYTIDELKTVFSPLTLEYSELMQVPTRFKDEIYERCYWWAVFRKP